MRHFSIKLNQLKVGINFSFIGLLNNRTSYFKFKAKTKTDSFQTPDKTLKIRSWDQDSSLEKPATEFDKH